MNKTVLSDLLDLKRVKITDPFWSYYVELVMNTEYNLRIVGKGRTQLLSTECMVSTFTGCFFGLFAEGSGTAWFDYFMCLPESKRDYICSK